MFLQTLARILADKMHIQVIYDSSISTFQIRVTETGAMVIALATTILDTAGDNVDVVVRGALAHEALGHGYFTSFTSSTKNGEYADSLANAFEDVRIEQLAPTRFPGARRLLAEMVTVLEENYGFWKVPSPDDWQDSLLVGLLRKYRWKILGQALDVAKTEVILAQAIAVIGHDLFRQIDSLAEAACRSGSTEEVNDASDAIVDLLRDFQSKSESGASAKAPGDQKPDAAFDPSRKVAADVEAGLAVVTDDKGALRKTHLSIDGFQDVSDGALEADSTEVVATNGALARMISARLDEAVRSITEDGEDEESDLGRLNRSLLPTVMTGVDCLAFVEDGAPGPGIDTELMLVFDESLSMRDLGVPLLREMLKASLMSLARIAPDLGTSAAFFSDNSTLLVRPGQLLTPGKINAIVGRYTPRGGTSWEESVVPLMPVLSRSHRRRKIMLTVTDGRVTSGLQSRVLAQMRTLGIECRFLSIGVPLPDTYPGQRCDATADAFGKAFCDTILAGILPEFV